MERIRYYSAAKYASGFGEPQERLYKRLLKERQVAEEYLKNFDPEENEKDEVAYADYLAKLDELIITMKNFYEIEQENPNLVYVVKMSLETEDDDTWEVEYSGIYHMTRNSAEQELAEAKEHSVDDETVRYCYIDCRTRK